MLSTDQKQKFTSLAAGILKTHTSQHKDLFSGQVVTELDLEMVSLAEHERIRCSRNWKNSNKKIFVLVV